MKRIVAIVMPELACEIARQRASVKGPLGVILVAEGASPEATAQVATLDVVSVEAHRLGIRAGQSVPEAAAIASHLAVQRVSYTECRAALGRVAEVALALGTTAAIELEASDRDSSGNQGRLGSREPLEAWSLDTVWLDVTGSAHLVGGEEALIAELTSRATALGHRARVAIADGPRLAQAIARWSTERSRVVPSGEGAQAIAGLPIRALSLDAELASFFVRVGVLLVRDLVRLPRASVAARLGARAPMVLALAEGRDDSPLVSFSPPRVLVEETQFEEGTEQSTPLLFVLRGMTSRLAARLGARGEAATRLELTILYDRSIARLRAAAAGVLPEAELAYAVDLPSPLAREAEIFSPLKTKMETMALLAPAVGIRLAIPEMVPAPSIQLDLSRDVAVSPSALPALLAELSAEIGAERVGVLASIDAHRPEAQSALISPFALRARKAPARSRTDDDAPPTRLLPVPLRIGKVREGAVIAVEQRLYAVERVQFVMRLDAVEWWTASATRRDYARAWLTSGDRGHAATAPPVTTAEAFIFVDRTSGEYFLQGFCE